MEGTERFPLPLSLLGVTASLAGLWRERLFSCFLHMPGSSTSVGWKHRLLSDGSFCFSFFRTACRGNPLRQPFHFLRPAAGAPCPVQQPDHSRQIYFNPSTPREVRRNRRQPIPWKSDFNPRTSQEVRQMRSKKKAFEEHLFIHAPRKEHPDPDIGQACRYWLTVPCCQYVQKPSLFLNRLPTMHCGAIRKCAALLSRFG